MSCKCKNVLAIAVLLLCIATSLLLVFDKTIPNYYTNLWLLPLSYGIVVFFAMTISHSVWNNFVYIITIMIFGVRNVVTPLAMRFGHYAGYIRVSDSSYVNKAIALMIFDSTVLLLYCAVKTNRIRSTKEGCLLNIDRTRIEDMICLFFILFQLGSFLAVRGAYSGFSTIITATNSRIIDESVYPQGVFYTLFNVLFPISYLYISLYLMSRVNRWIGNKLLRVFLNIICICIPFVFMNGSDGFNLICVICLGLASLRMQGISKQILTYGIFGMVGIIVIYFLMVVAGLSSSSAGLSGVVLLSKALQAYFPGVCNFAGFFGMGSHNKWRTLFYDLYATIPFRNTLFGLKNDERLVVLMARDIGSVSQILPCGAQFFYYFSIFGPLLECLFVKIALVRTAQASNEASIYSFFADYLLSIYLVLSLVLYNFTIFMSRYLVTILPFTFIAYLVKRNSVQKGYTYGHSRINEEESIHV